MSKKKKSKPHKRHKQEVEPTKYYKNVPPTKGKVLNGKTKINLLLARKLSMGVCSVLFHVSHTAKVR